VDEGPALLRTIRAIAAGERDAVTEALAASPALATLQLTQQAMTGPSSSYFLPQCSLQLYAGDTALHVAAACYAVDIARRLIALGADLRARNRRGAEPIHAATTGNPDSPNWDPERQAAMITLLLTEGSDPNALAAGGVTPLHRAVRNRCSSAVAALLDGGADPSRVNDSGSTPLMLAGWTTGRGGSGSAAAKREQAKIVRLLEAATTEP